MMSIEESDRSRWIATEAAVRELLPAVRDIEGFALVVRYLRPPAGPEMGGPGHWARQPDDCDARRQALLHEVVDLAEQVTGEQWPFPDDARPEVPDTPEGLET